MNCYKCVECGDYIHKLEDLLDKVCDICGNDTFVLLKNISICKEIEIKINYLDYQDTISNEVLNLAKDNGIVIIYGTINNIVKLNGAINKDLYIYNDTTIYINNTGLITSGDKTCCCKDNISGKLEIIGKDYYKFLTKIPHENFHVHYNTDDSCRLGLIFRLQDIKEFIK